MLLEDVRNLHSSEEPVRNQSSPQTSERGDGCGASESWQEDAGTDNTFPGGRYDDKDLAEYTKALWNFPGIQLP
ncbi:hypothetical protein PI124_g15687 [Phytophthora idaei]|nr:hypothetical protein PI125_g26356 [Phytophthora idaei]KAG3125563.1 hypothetical protein PI126_g22711 [Phytophthora idaei]KAG3239381.1 hypothetical protein PI124_g15687 [Phytophthora idaei]